MPYAFGLGNNYLLADHFCYQERIPLQQVGTFNLGGR